MSKVCSTGSHGASGRIHRRSDSWQLASPSETDFAVGLQCFKVLADCWSWPNVKCPVWIQNKIQLGFNDANKIRSVITCPCWTACISLRLRSTSSSPVKGRGGNCEPVKICDDSQLQSWRHLKNVKFRPQKPACRKELESNVNRCILHPTVKLTRRSHSISSTSQSLRTSSDSGRIHSSLGILGLLAVQFLLHIRSDCLESPKKKQKHSGAKNHGERRFSMFQPPILVNDFQLPSDPSAKTHANSNATESRPQGISDRHDSRDFPSRAQTPRLHDISRHTRKCRLVFLEMLPVENLVLEKAPQRPGQINRASYCNNLADSTHVQNRSCWIWSAWHLQKVTYLLEKLRSRPLAQAKLLHKLCPAKQDNYSQLARMSNVKTTSSSPCSC